MAKDIKEKMGRVGVGGAGLGVGKQVSGGIFSGDKRGVGEASAVMSFRKVCWVMCCYVEFPPPLLEAPSV